jgi:cytochrome c oxidase cbb3-type subunit 1/cytochrome c oxidase cbb3-type subunit I/II
MVIPVMIFLINIWYTVKGKLGVIYADIAGKFIFTGTIMYFFVNIQGSIMALPQVQRVTHFNNWVVAHAHLGVLGFAGMTALGGLYYILPKITGKPLYSRFLADLQYWFVQQVSGGPAILVCSHRGCRLYHRADNRGADSG